MKHAANSFTREEKTSCDLAKSARLGKGEYVVVTRGEFAGLGGKIRMRVKDGRFIVNLFSPGRGIAFCPRFRG
jgi:transcription antitermination factor NusG